MSDTPRCAPPQPCHRLIPSRFPPVQAFDFCTSPEELEAVIELEGWTNDRLVAERLARLDRDEWVFGVPNASVVMAAFLHAAPAGTRFAGPELGAWYASAALRTAIAEVAHHLRREAVALGRAAMRRSYRAYRATLSGDDWRDLRIAAPPGVLDRHSHAAGQLLGEAARAAGEAGFVYPSLRHAGGVNIVAYRPRRIGAVTQAEHFDITAPRQGKVVARLLRGGYQ
ncbi:hypothetical protein DFH01_02765 [Falsiroseomonas bella]|uniref:RES domain-containing protein n=1 Tax=Falsiroseomonas bella TaxID=2184016 RepID=A0A317FKW9_9PROT|nr:RES family NAD+ phosphorylase [Falsiroseomonas bella]PWS38236.1 hypothetical protein DFH01_02765 [Falsiroseomonas bella]